VRKERASVVQEGVGRRIAEEREARGWTQQDVADKLKVEVQSYQRFERGEIATISTIVKLANVFGVTARSLFDEPKSRKRRAGRPKKSA
jgi:transcriptional regulator with XRE-family HTH domain